MTGGMYHDTIIILSVFSITSISEKKEKELTQKEKITRNEK